MPIKLFISKPIDEVGRLKTFCNQRGWKLIAKSFLTFEPTLFSWNNEEDIIFFSSPRAVDFFNRQFPLSTTKIYACAGKKTEDKLAEYGLRADFVADHSGMVTDMAKGFAEFAKGRSVIFPISNLSQQSYSQYLAKGSFRFVQVYATKINPAIIEDCDLYIFTSPSNIRGFLMENPANSKLSISWGETTAKYLNKSGFKVLKQLKISSIDYLIEVLSNIQDQETRG